MKSLWLIATLMLATGVSVSPRVTIAGKPKCRKCRIEVTREVGIGEREGPGALIDFENVTVGRGGRFYVNQSRQSDHFNVYRADGRLLRSVGGKRGSGPGEYRRIAYVHEGPDGLIYVFDIGNRRLVRLDSTFSEVSSIPNGISPHGMAFVNDTLILAARGSNSETVGYPAHMLTRNGTVTRSFGAATPIERPDVPTWNIRALAASRRHGGVWLAFRQQYVIELWGLDNQRKLELVRVVDWFKPWSRRARTGDHPPEPMLVGIHEDHDGRLWVVSVVPGSSWQRALAKVRTIHGTAEQVSDYNAFFDTVVEVLDPERGEVVASRRLPQVISQVLPDGRFVGIEIDANGFVYPQILRPRLFFK